MRVAIYTRVSTLEQEQKGTSLQTQLEACEKYCQSKGYEIAYRFAESFSGLSLGRPELDKMRQLIRDGRIDIVVCYSLDRLTRDPEHGVVLTQELAKHHVTLEAVTESVDSTELGKLISYIRNYTSKIEAIKIRERVMRGKTARVAMGKLPTGAGRGLFGYSWSKIDKKRVINETEAAVVLRVFTLLTSGMSRFAIARRLNQEGVLTKAGKTWSPALVHHLLTNESYIGKTYYGRVTMVDHKPVRQPESEWKSLPGITPPIITEDLFNQAQKILAGTKELRIGRPTRQYLLRGFIRCGYCNQPMTGTLSQHKFPYYVCRATQPTAQRGRLCFESKGIRADHLDAALWQKIKGILKHPEVLEAEFQRQYDINRSQTEDTSIDREIVRITRKLKGYSANEKNLISLLGHGEETRNHVLDVMNDIKREREADEAELQRLKELKKRLEEVAKAQFQLQDFCAKINMNVENASFDDKRLALKALGVVVNVSAEKVEVRYRIDLQNVTDIPLVFVPSNIHFNVY